MSHYPETGHPGRLLPAIDDPIAAAVHQEFQTNSPFRRLLADDLADSLRLKRCFSDVSNQALDAEIGGSWDQVTQRCPNAGPALRTVLAWGEFYKLPGARAALLLRRQFLRALDANLHDSLRLARSRKAL